MARTDILIGELTRETTTARKHLERLPGDRYGWRPHVKSFTAGELASHLLDCIRWVEPIFGADEFDMDPSVYTPFRADSMTTLLHAFDADVARATQAIENSDDRDAAQQWRFKIRGAVRFEKPREAVFRDMTLNHLVHHRGQMSVYLRLLDVAVPGSYGPTADDRW